MNHLNGFIQEFPVSVPNGFLWSHKCNFAGDDGFAGSDRWTHRCIRQEHKMPFRIEYEEGGTGILVTWTGTVTAEEIRELNRIIYANDSPGRIRYQIWDFTKADRHNLTVRDLREFAMQDKAGAQRHPDQIGVFVGSRDFFSGYDQIFHIYEEVWSGLKSRTFATVDDARKWISEAAGDEFV